MFNGFALAEPFCAANNVNQQDRVKIAASVCRDGDPARGRFRGPGDQVARMGSISRYIFRTTFGAFALVLISLTAVIWVTQALRDIDIMTSQGQTILVFVGITGLIIPLLVLVIAPIALLIAVVHVLNKLSTDSEIIVMSAAGMSPWFLFRAFMSVTIVVSILVMSISAYFAPQGLRMLRDWLTEVRANVVSTIVQPGRFTSIEANVTIHIRERRTNGQLIGIFLDDRRNPNERMTVIAERGDLVDNDAGTFLVLQDGIVQRQETRKPDPAMVAILRGGFAMENPDDDSQIVQVSPEGGFAIVKLDRIVPAAPRPLAAIRDAIPVPAPEKIICVGVNFPDRNAEYKDGQAAQSNPSLFVRFPRSFVGHDAPLIRPPESLQLDYEGEIAIVIGKAGRRIAEADALGHIAALTLCNEGTIRDWVRHAKFNVTQGKNFDRTGSIGPWLIPYTDESQIADIALETRVNGEVRQHDRTSRMIFSFRKIINYVSTFTTLVPGDILVTGTPTGAGARFDPPVWLKPGDIVEVEAEGIGLLRNGIADEG